MEKVKLSNGKEYEVKEILYRDLKMITKTAGNNKERMQDLLILECIPALKMEELDVLPLRDVKIIGDAIQKVTGLEVKQAEGF
jgi:hypothetical protein